MARLARAEVFAPDEIAVVHVYSRVVRRCFLMGDDPVTGNNYDHRKAWIEGLLRWYAGLFGIDLLAFAILSNHFHLILRSRPDVVALWDDREVARRWRMICPVRRLADGSAQDPTEAEINSIANDPAKLKEIRSRLSDISWWMRLLCQRVAQQANREDGASGRFWESRYRAVRLLDEAAILACSAYVDLNPIRAGIARSLEDSDHTSIQRRLESNRSSASDQIPQESVSRADCFPSPSRPTKRTSGTTRADTDGQPSDRSADGNSLLRRDAFLSPLSVDAGGASSGPCPHAGGHRCSDKGYLTMSQSEYVELLRWTVARLDPSRPRKGRRRKARRRSARMPQALRRLNLNAHCWTGLVSRFGELFSLVAGRPQRIDAYRGRLRGSRYYVPAAGRDLFASA